MKALAMTKTVMRNSFTKLFSPHRIGKRKIAYQYTYRHQFNTTKRTSMQRIRRSKQGAANRIYGSITALQLRRQFGRLPTVPLFWR